MHLVDRCHGWLNVVSDVPLCQLYWLVKCETFSWFCLQQIPMTLKTNSFQKSILCQLNNSPLPTQYPTLYQHNNSPFTRATLYQLSLYKHKSSPFTNTRTCPLPTQELALYKHKNSPFTNSPFTNTRTRPLQHKNTPFTNSTIANFLPIHTQQFSPILNPYKVYYPLPTQYTIHYQLNIHALLVRRIRLEGVFLIVGHHLYCHANNP